MKKIVLTLAILFLFLGCHRKVSYEVTLRQIDSIIIDRPVAAYQMLRNIHPDSLRRRDRPYYALLMTQAMHKNYVPLESDSLINIAVRYYDGRNDFKKYAKALLYKGAVAEEINDPQRAMEIYTEAEKIALKTDDYLTIGLINSQMAFLYNNMYIENNEDIERLKRSLEFFKKAGHSANVNHAVGRIGQFYRTTDQRDSAYYYLQMAVNIAVDRNDSLAIFQYSSFLANTYFLDGNYVKAKQVSLDIINQHGSIPVVYETYHCLSRSYARLHKPDSALYYYNKVKDLDSKNSENRNMVTYAEILKAEGYYAQALSLTENAHHIADSVIDEARRTDLYKVEKRYNNQRLENINQRLEYKTRINLYFIILISLVAVIILIISLIVIDRKRRDISETISFMEQLKTDTKIYSNTLLEKLDEKSRIEIQLKDALEKRIQTIRELMDISYRYGALPDTFVKQFNKTMNINRLSDGALDDLCEVVNAKYDGVIDYFQSQHADLNTDDINLLCLICCGFSATEMSVFYNHNNGKSIYSRKRRLAMKMNIDNSLDEYVIQSLELCHNQKKSYFSENQLVTSR